MADDHRTNRKFPVVTILLIVINTVVFFMTAFRPDFDRIVADYGFVAQQFDLPDMVTCLFLHADFGHLFFNMFFLWLFGDHLEERFGGLLFLLFYLVAGIFTDIMYWTTARHSWMVMSSIGASGAVSAVLGCYMILNPGAKISFLTLFGEPFEVDAFTYFGIWFTGQFILMAMGGQDVNYVAHLMGFVFGIFAATIKQAFEKER